eukprot:scaffold1637_cov253-Pinguiococcus_pyrenoidosus.AAC.14
MLTSFSTAAWPASVCSPPMSTRGGSMRSSIAVPSARNSGLLSTWKFRPRSLHASTRRIAAAVRTGTVDFSTTILSLRATSAIFRAQSSQFLMFAALPAPMPFTFHRSMHKVTCYDKQTSDGKTARGTEGPSISARAWFVPWVLVGVLTEMKMMSASFSASSMAVVKKRFLKASSQAQPSSCAGGTPPTFRGSPGRSPTGPARRLASGRCSKRQSASR